MLEYFCRITKTSVIQNRNMVIKLLPKIVKGYCEEIRVHLIMRVKLIDFFQLELKQDTSLGYVFTMTRKLAQLRIHPRTKMEPFN